MSPIGQHLLWWSRPNFMTFVFFRVRLRCCLAWSTMTIRIWTPLSKARAPETMPILQISPRASEWWSRDYYTRNTNLARSSIRPVRFGLVRFPAGPVRFWRFGSDTPVRFWPVPKISVLNFPKIKWEICFLEFWHLLESSKNHFPMVRGELFFEKFKLFFSCNVGTS